jgi:hypothetical protein
LSFDLRHMLRALENVFADQRRCDSDENDHEPEIEFVHI